ncbi:transporter [Allostella sp. ATCC 35155]|nr:transporter [Stella sp. ATCC 35155]
MTVAAAASGSRWTSSIGFVLATLGSAIGLGNIWRFSYVVGENGGGAFILVYLLAVLVLGVPLLVAELAIGRATEGNAVSAFERITDRAPWKWTGWLGAAASVGILSYYPVIAGWVASYFWNYASGAGNLLAGTTFSASFAALIADPVRVVLWSAIVIGGAAAVVAVGVGRGIERACKILMPTFFAIVLLLAAYGLTLPGAGQAMEFLFAPDWNALLEPKTYLAAVGQAFFSIGLAMGIVVTFGGYLKGQERLLHAALVIAVGDTAIALLAGIMIFPMVFSFGVDPAAGPTLAFVVLPEMFATLPSGRWLATAFFGLLLIAALTSIMALLEVPIAVLVSKLGWRRPYAAAAVAIGIILLGIPAALSYGVLRDLSVGGAPLLDVADYLSSNIILPLSGIAIALFVGWSWPSAAAATSAGFARPWLHEAWMWSLRIVIPLLVAAAMMRGLGWV